MASHRTPIDALDAFEEVLQHEEHTARIWACAVSPDGKIVASSSRDKTARVFQVEGQKEIGLRQLHTDAVYDIALNGRQIATAGRDGVVYVRKQSNPSTTILREGTVSDYNWARSAKLSPDGRKIAFSITKTVFVNKIATQENLHTLETNCFVVRIAANKDQTIVFILGKNETTGTKNFLQVWDINRGTVTRYTNVPIPDTEHYPGIATNATGDLLAIADHDSLRLWKVGADNATSLPGYYPPDEDCDCALTPDGRRLVASMGRSGFGVWDCDNNALLYVTSEYSVVACAISDSGRTIVFGCEDYSVHVWSLKPSFEVANGEHENRQVARQEDIDRIEKTLRDLILGENRNALRTALQNMASAL